MISVSLWKVPRATARYPCLMHLKYLVIVLALVNVTVKLNGIAFITSASEFVSAGSLVFFSAHY